MSEFNWPALMRAGMHGLRLRPEDFWALTPVELQLMLGAASGAASMNKSGLDALLKAYPDTNGGTKDESD